MTLLVTGEAGFIESDAVGRPPEPERRVAAD